MTDETQDTTEDVEVTVAPEEKLHKFDSKEVEDALMRMAQERADDPVEVAAHTYRTYLPFYRAQLPKLSTRALRRVIKFIVEYPLEKSEIGAASKEEREMMELVNTLVQAKFVMILGTFSQQEQHIYDSAMAPLTQEQADEIADELGLDKTTVVNVEYKQGE